jgi:hypothetical protein
MSYASSNGICHAGGAITDNILAIGQRRRALIPKNSPCACWRLAVLKATNLTASLFLVMSVSCKSPLETILCITHLFSESEVNPKFRARMLEEMLELNIPMPLSSFSKIGERYVVFGALSVNSSMDDICHELITVTENAVEALLAMEEFVRQDV